MEPVRRARGLFDNEGQGKQAMAERMALCPVVQGVEFMIPAPL